MEKKYNLLISITHLDICIYSQWKVKKKLPPYFETSKHVIMHSRSSHKEYTKVNDKKHRITWGGGEQQDCYKGWSGQWDSGGPRRWTTPSSQCQGHISRMSWLDKNYRGQHATMFDKDVGFPQQRAATRGFFWTLGACVNTVRAHQQLEI